MTAYTIVDHQKIDDHITFIRIDPNSIELTLKEVFFSLSNLSWINRFDDEYVKNGFSSRADKTIKHISDWIIKDNESSITKDSGEYVISELARKSIVKELGYSDIPLAELI